MSVERIEARDRPLLRRRSETRRSRVRAAPAPRPNLHRTQLLDRVDRELETAKNTVARSRHAVAAAEEDLKSHRLWLDRQRQIAEGIEKRRLRDLQRQKALGVFRRVSASIFGYLGSLSRAMLERLSLAARRAASLLASACASVSAKLKASALLAGSQISRCGSWMATSSAAVARSMQVKFARAGRSIAARASQTCRFLTGFLSSVLPAIATKGFALARLLAGLLLTILLVLSAGLASLLAFSAAVMVKGLRRGCAAAVSAKAALAARRQAAASRTPAAIAATQPPPKERHFRREPEFRAAVKRPSAPAPGKALQTATPDATENQRPKRRESGVAWSERDYLQARIRALGNRTPKPEPRRQMRVPSRSPTRRTNPVAPAAEKAFAQDWKDLRRAARAAARSQHSFMQQQPATKHRRAGKRFNWDLAAPPEPPHGRRFNWDLAPSPEPSAGKRVNWDLGTPAENRAGERCNGAPPSAAAPSGGRNVTNGVHPKLPTAVPPPFWTLPLSSGRAIYEAPAMLGEPGPAAPTPGLASGSPTPRL